MQFEPVTRTILGAAVVGAALSTICAPCLAQPEARQWTNSIGMKFVRIGPGEFVMGSGEAPPRDRQEWESRDADEAPAHKVRISKAFGLGAYEVTNAQYEQFDPEHRALRGRQNSSRADDDPAAFVTWQQANDFCQWLSRKEGKPYRLPTEAEWEYACRAGTATAYGIGDQLGPADANFGVAADGKRKPVAVPVGSFKPNAWGLYDMHGNVAEWCLDWYGPYEPGDQTDPVGRVDGYARVTRGWSSLRTSHPKGAARYCRSANRSGQLPEDANYVTGFRVVQGEKPATTPAPVVLPLCQQNVAQSAPPSTGPDPTKPYFVNFSAQGRSPVIARDSWGPVFSQWNHYSTVCACPNGDILAVWYTTVQEEGRELAQGASRLRAGSDRWEPASSFFDVPDVNDHAPVLLSDGKRLYHFCTQSLHSWDYASDIVRVSDDSGATWSKPRIMVARDDRDHLSQPCSAIALADGTLVLACDGDNHHDERLIVSPDRGKTWRVAKGDIRKTAGKYVIHPALYQRDDGALACFMRGPHPMPCFVSRDMGGTWEEQATPFPGISVGQKAAALKLAGGALLLCSHDNKKGLVGGGTFAALSLDDGKTWAHVRKVEGPSGYMSLTQDRNGVIYLFGPSSARPACAAFNEAWLKEGKPVVAGAAPLTLPPDQRPAWLAEQGIVMAGSWEPLSFRVRRDGAPDYTPTPEQSAAYLREHSPEMVARLKAMGVNFVMMHCHKGGGLKFEEESMADAVRFAKLCREAGLRVGVYNFSGTFMWEPFFKEFPQAADWAVVGPDGKKLTYGPAKYRYYANRNHPEAQAFYEKLIRFSVKEIQADLLHFDNYVVGPGWDANSVERFRRYLRDTFSPDQLAKAGIGEVSAVEPPRGNAPGLLRNAWHDFTCRSLADSYLTLNRFARSLRPDVLVECNPNGVEPSIRPPVDHGRLLQGGEAFWDESSRAPGIRNGVLHTRIRTLKVARAMNNMVFAYVTNPLEAAESMAFNLDCLGAVCWFEYAKITEQPGSSKPVSPALDRYVRFYHRRHDLLSKNRVVADVAVLRSFPSQVSGGEPCWRLTAKVEDALIRSCACFDILHDHQIEDLARYRCLVLAGCTALSDSQFAAIRRYAASGGMVCTIGPVATHDPWMTPRARPGLDDLPSGRVVRVGQDDDPLAGIRSACQGRFSLSVQAKAAEGLCAQVTEQPQRRLVHLVNYRNDGPLMDVGVRLRLPEGKRVKRVTLVSPEREDVAGVAFQEQDGEVVFGVPQVAVYEIAVVDVAAK
jgi:formylglycine-generating enzyme required for sulfatase activity